MVVDLTKRHGGADAPRRMLPEWYQRWWGMPQLSLRSQMLQPAQGKHCLWECMLGLLLDAMHVNEATRQTAQHAQSLQLQ